MYNQGMVRLHVDLFIKYVSNNGQFYIGITNNWQRKLLIKLKSILSSMFKLRWSPTRGHSIHVYGSVFSELFSVQSEVFFELLSTMVYFHLSDQIMIGSLLESFLCYSVNPPTVLSFVFTFLEL